MDHQIRRTMAACSSRLGLIDLGLTKSKRLMVLLTLVAVGVVVLNRNS